MPHEEAPHEDLSPRVGHEAPAGLASCAPRHKDGSKHLSLHEHLHVVKGSACWEEVEGYSRAQNGAHVAFQVLSTGALTERRSMNRLLHHGLGKVDLEVDRELLVQRILTALEDNGTHSVRTGAKMSIEMLQARNWMWRAVRGLVFDMGDAGKAEQLRTLSESVLRQRRETIHPNLLYCALETYLMDPHESREDKRAMAMQFCEEDLEGSVSAMGAPSTSADESLIGGVCASTKWLAIMWLADTLQYSPAVKYVCDELETATRAKESRDEPLDLTSGPSAPPLLGGVKLGLLFQCVYRFPPQALQSYFTLARLSLEADMNGTVVWSDADVMRHMYVVRMLMSCRLPKDWQNQGRPRLTHGRLRDLDPMEAERYSSQAQEVMAAYLLRLRERAEGPWDAVRKKALAALSFMGRSRDADIITPDLVDPNASVVSEAARALERLQGVRSTTRLITAASARVCTEESRSRLCVALRAMNKEEVADELESMLDTSQTEEMETVTRR
eukprot:gene2656-3424_t